MKGSGVQDSMAEFARGFSESRWSLSASGVRQTLSNVLVQYKGGLGRQEGPGRGHHGHVGRPGKQGGSLPGGMGQCYASAAKWVMEHPDVTSARLAHGTAVGTGGNIVGQEYGHAWVEVGPIVLDTKSGWVGSRGAFYTAGQIREVARYDRDQVLENVLRSETWGPWEAQEV